MKPPWSANAQRNARVIVYLHRRRAPSILAAFDDKSLSLSLSLSLARAELCFRVRNDYCSCLSAACQYICENATVLYISNNVLQN